MTATIQDMRAEFEKLAQNAEYHVSRDAWLTLVRLAAQKLASGDTVPTPEQWLKAARTVRVRCNDCGGSGRYSWGASVNGKPSKSGTCFRCGGQGTQGQDDFRRNRNYDNYCRRVI